MKILYVWDADYPWDVRVAKIASALTDSGHSVAIACRNLGGRAQFEELPEASVRRLPHWAVSVGINRWSSFPAFFNPRWFWHILESVRKSRSDVIVVRDLPLAPTAIAVGRLTGKPVVLDMAENYGAMTQALFDNGVASASDYVVRNPTVVRGIERWVLRHIDHVLVVVDESAARLERLGLDATQISVVSNTPPASRLTDFPPRSHQPGEVHLVYLGLLEAPRGLGIVLDAVAACKTSGVRVRLSIVGSGRERERFEQQARNLGLTSQEVAFLGYLPNVDALRLIAEGDVGLVPHQANESWNTTIPNKLFDYMAAGLAVITSDAVPAARVVRNVGAGEIYAWNSPIELSRAIAALADPARRSECGIRGRDAVANEYSWAHDCTRLLSALQHVAGRGA